MKTQIRLAAVILIIAAIMPGAVFAENITPTEKAGILVSFVLYEIFISSYKVKRK